jgi:hypothetical protein
MMTIPLPAVIHWVSPSRLAGLVPAQGDAARSASSILKSSLRLTRTGDSARVPDMRALRLGMVVGPAVVLAVIWPSVLI